MPRFAVTPAVRLFRFLTRFGFRAARPTRLMVELARRAPGRFFLPVLPPGAASVGLRMALSLLLVVGNLPVGAWARAARQAAAQTRPADGSAGTTRGAATLTTVVGAREALTAVPRDAQGRPVNGLTPTWSSSEPSVLRVTEQGFAEAVGVGRETD